MHYLPSSTTMTRLCISPSFGSFILFFFRFPGGESYADLIDRLYSIVIDMEQQLGLTVAVSHVSVLQVLLSYFRSSPIHNCMDVEVPMHTVFKFVPLRGGGWHESRHVLLDVQDSNSSSSSGSSGGGGGGTCSDRNDAGRRRGRQPQWCTHLG